MVDLGRVSVRLEDRPLITGGGRYVGDLVDTGTLHCAFVRSPVAHGRLVPPDLDEVRDLPGVVAVFGAGDLDLPDMPSSPHPGAPEATGMGQPPLARDRVRYVGEPVAVVVADSATQAVDAAGMVWVDVEDLTAVDPISALEGDVLLFPDSGSNVVHRQTIGSEGSRPPAELEALIEVDIPRISPVTIEPLTILARPVNSGLEVWCGHQQPAGLPAELGVLLGLDPTGIRVRVPDVGGGFGTKGQFYPEYPVVAAIAHRLRRPVVWLQSRTEQLVCGTHGRAMHVTVRIGGDLDGRIRYVVADMVGDAGAYPCAGARVPFFSLPVMQGPYDVEHLEVTGTAVVTNRAPVGPYRGAGRPEAAIAIERAVDAFADAAGVLPEDVRRRSFIDRTNFPFTTHTGSVYDSGDYATALELALETVDIARWRRLQAGRRAVGGDPIGIGIASFVERAGGAPGTGEYGRVELDRDGGVVVRTGSTPAGQGHRTVWSQIAAGVFSVPAGSVTFYTGDTAEVADGVGSFASRSAQLGGSAVLRTALAVRNQARTVAAGMLEASEADLVLVDGSFGVVGSPGATVTLSEVAAAAGAAGIELAAEEMYIAKTLAYPFGSYVAVVEVERETGEVQLLSLVAVDDCGNVLNPMIVEGQVHGSIMQGIGEALLEEVIYDTDGQPMNANLAAYLVPTATQPFPLTIRRTTTPSPGNPLGVKGTGEAGCIGAPPAILNAVYDALREDGVTSLNLPLTPARVWEAIRSARYEGPRPLAGGS
ncbi:MAG: xanthine dehydrogenase family protein molybdopterin-binding subunit [bacterium]|nr:xanthine dehydrogenase family protein molybdopterin-binding subunit [bacterium]MDE0290076.1 xanthine dehydrogenase family protein molybdopterin-binding subunit [bacterium]MDE0437473.1 xanthine dehydrogenase family protein molybdopterin-binding subunit [bacterium]